MQPIRDALKNPRFSVALPSVDWHVNHTVCLLIGRDGPISIQSENAVLKDDVLLIKPGIKHRLSFSNSGADVIYLDATAWNIPDSIALPLRGGTSKIARSAMAGDLDSLDAVKIMCKGVSRSSSAQLDAVIKQIISNPMERMSQYDLARCLGLERTVALRFFKSVTGQTFRSFKQWKGICAAVADLSRGELIRTAALDAGFSDAAHFSRTIRGVFGLTPSEAVSAIADGQLTVDY